MAVWTWALGGTPASGNGAQRQLTTGRGRTITWRLDAAASAQFTIDGTHNEIAGWTRLATDLYVRRNGTLLFRGRVGPEQGAIGTEHVVSLTAVDYRAMLDTKYVAETGATYVATDQAAIAWGLISTAQARTGGSLGITNGVGSSSGTNRDRAYDPGKPIGEAISELGRVDNGFEWEIDANLALNRWYPQRGADNGVVLDHGGLITRVEYGFDPGRFTNAPMAVGGQGTAPVVAVSGTIAADPRGRWERAIASPSIVEQATVTARAAFLLDDAGTLKVDYLVTLRPGAWGGMSHIGLGDIVDLTIRSGRVTEAATPHRVVEISASIDEHGTETILMWLVAA